MTATQTSTDNESAEKDRSFRKVAALAEEMIAAHGKDFTMGAFILAATATYLLPRYELVGQWPHQEFAPVRPPVNGSQTCSQWLGVAVAIIVLLTANAWEAHQIVTYGSTVIP